MHTIFPKKEAKLHLTHLLHIHTFGYSLDPPQAQDSHEVTISSVGLGGWAQMVVVSLIATRSGSTV